MIKRTKKGQKKHDESVFRSATWYKNKGFKTSADLPGWEKPKSIGGFVPDLIAKKGKKEIILEVETKDTVDLDKDQQKVFKDYSNRGKGRIFRKKTV
jgi:hypothetical protein